MSKPIARIGDKHVCPKHGKGVIVSGTAHSLAGSNIATVGSKTSCGATIVSGSSSMNIDGKPVATIGSKTSHGGVIVKGSSNGVA